MYRLIVDADAAESTHYPLAGGGHCGWARPTHRRRHPRRPHAGRSSVVPEQARACLDGSYITGGLGAGFASAEKMANAGAGRIVLSSRSQPSRVETIEPVRAIGSDVVVECGDIACAGHRRPVGHGGHRDGSKLRAA